MIEYRTIKKTDNQIICNIIRTSLEEFGGKRPGTAYYDKDTESMFEAYQGKRKIYFVVEIDGEIMGGGGVQHLANTDENIAELQKLYLLKKSRGLGIGKKIVEMCIDFARQNNFSSIYLETFPNMDAAITLYRKFDFSLLDTQLGETGHTGCHVRMLKKL